MAGGVTIAGRTGAETIDERSMRARIEHAARSLEDVVGAGAPVAITSADPVGSLVGFWGARLAGSVPLLVPDVDTRVAVAVASCDASGATALVRPASAEVVLPDGTAYLQLTGGTSGPPTSVVIAESAMREH